MLNHLNISLLSKAWYQSDKPCNLKDIMILTCVSFVMALHANARSQVAIQVSGTTFIWTLPNEITFQMPYNF